MDSARARAGYADARFVRSRVERLSTRNGRLDQLESHESEGIGVRVRVRGAWGFAAVRGGERADAEAALARALGIAAVAVDGGESQTRSYPASHGGHVEQAGYEHFIGLELPGHAPRVAAEAA